MTGSAKQSRRSAARTGLLRPFTPRNDDQIKNRLELTIPIAAPPGPAGAHIHSKSAAQQKLFSGAVVFELGSRAAAVVGRLRRRPYGGGGKCCKHGCNGGGCRNQRRAGGAAMDGIEFSHRLMLSIIRRQTSAGP